MSRPQPSCAPRPEHHFTFDMWTVGNRGLVPFGASVAERGDGHERLDQLVTELLLGVRWP